MNWLDAPGTWEGVMVRRLMTRKFEKEIYVPLVRMEKNMKIFVSHITKFKNVSNGLHY